MGKINQEVLAKKIQSVKSGSYWFEVISKISIIFGVLIFIFNVIVTTIILRTTPNIPTDALMSLLKMWSEIIILFIYAWLFLKASDAFKAIECIINELMDIV